MAYSKKDLVLRSQKRVEKDKRNLDVYFRYNQLINNGSQVWPSLKQIESEFGVSHTTIYHIIKVMRERVTSLIEIYPEYKKKYKDFITV